MPDKMPILYFVVPCYNEEAVLPETSKRLLQKLNELISVKKIDAKSRILFVNDGSKDNTWNYINELFHDNQLFAGVCLSRNRGHQNALFAGLMTALDYADVSISLDADLQDDINIVDQMLDKYLYDHCQIVYGVRNVRKTDTFFKRFTAEGFYKLMNAMGVEIVFNHADYRLMSKVALNALSQYKEVNLFLRGIVPLLGYKSDIVYYARQERFAGESKYPLKKMAAFALDGITSFSIKPLRMITTLGAVIFSSSVFVLIWILASKLLGQNVHSWTLLILSLWALCGIQVLCLGFIGEYIGKIYAEVKSRPRYFISETLIR